MMDMAKQKQQLKEWFNKNKEQVKAFAIVTGVGISSYILGASINNLKCTGGIQSMRADGVIKFFDPETGLEVKTTKDACNVMAKINK